MKKEEYIKERNELAKQLYIHNENFSIEDSINTADSFMQKLYNCTLEECEYEKTPIVSIAEKDGIKGVRLCVGDVDIFIDAHDLDDGKEYVWTDAMTRLKEVGKETISYKQGLLMAAYHDEINAALREIGGDELKGYYWTSAERTTNLAWYVYFTNGYVYYDHKHHSFAVRACAELKQ